MGGYGQSQRYFNNDHHPRKFAAEWNISSKDKDLVTRIRYDVERDDYGSFMNQFRWSVASNRDFGYTEILLPVKEKSGNNCVSIMVRNRNFYIVAISNGEDMFEVGFEIDGNRHFTDAFFTDFGEYYRDMLGSDSLYGQTISRAIFRERVLAIVNHPNACTKWKVSAGLFAIMIAEPARFPWMSDVTTLVMALNTEVSFTGRFAWMAWMPKRWSPISFVARSRPQASDVLTKQADVKTNKGAGELLHNRVWSDSSLCFLTWKEEESDFGVQRTLEKHRQNEMLRQKQKRTDIAQPASKKQKISEKTHISEMEMEYKSGGAWSNTGAESSSRHALPRGMRMTSVDLLYLCITMVQRVELHKVGLPGPRESRIFSGPVSLDMSNIKLLRMHSYYTTRNAVTRCMMLITWDACYGIDKELIFKRLPCEYARKDADCALGYTLLEGEIVWADPVKKTGEMTYLVSDVLAINKKSLVHEPFHRRWESIEDVILQWNREFSSDVLKLERKQFYPLCAVPRLVKETLPYQSNVSDTLIFQPDDPKAPVLKWKFPELNTLNDPPEDEILRHIKNIIH